MTASLVIAIVVLGVSALLAPLQATFGASAANGGTTANATHLALGHIGSIQSGSSAQPEWIQSGIWVLRMIPSTDQAENPGALLIARFEMIKPDGTAMHVHKIYDFKASEITQEGNSTNVLKGTATITMKDGPVSNVPLTIRIFNNAVIGIWIGPDKVEGHFSTGPVYGILSANSGAVMQDMHSMMQGMMGQRPQPTGGNTTAQNHVAKISAKEVDAVYRWSNDDGLNPTLKLMANTNNIVQIDNPTDTKHELVIESNGAELASSGDIAPDTSGQLHFKPNMTGTLGYHCEYHPDTMKGVITVSTQ